MSASQEASPASLHAAAVSAISTAAPRLLLIAMSALEQTVPLTTRQAAAAALVVKRK